MNKKDISLRKPIILIGAARSGTTMLGDILSKHPDIAYWVEPKYIWKVRNPDIKNDTRTAIEATIKNKEYIQKKFQSFQNKQGKSRFLEKTPSNCFRIPFIDSVFQDAIYLNILRDGRDVSLSAYEKWTKKHDKSAYKRRIHFDDIPTGDLPFYLFDFSKQLLGQQFYPNQLKKWGPMTNEIQEYAKKSIEEACAFQWRQSTEFSSKALEKISSDRVFTFRYEDFIKDPECFLTKIFDHCQLLQSAKVKQYALEVIKPNNMTKWKKEENKDFIEKVDYILKPLLKELNYL